MKFRQFGYTEKKIEVRKMDIADVALTIAQTMVKKDIKDMEVRIVDCFAGEVETYKGLDDLLRQDWTSGHEVNVYNWAVMHSNVTDTDYLKVIIADNVYEEE